MGEINQALGACGGGYRLTLGGKDWTLQPPTKRLQGEFEAWLEGRARKEARALADGLPPELALPLLAGTKDAIEAGEYSFGGERCLRALNSPPGIVEMLFLMLRSAHPNVTRDEVAGLIRDHAAELVQAVKELLAARP